MGAPARYLWATRSLTGPGAAGLAGAAALAARTPVDGWKALALSGIATSGYVRLSGGWARRRERASVRLMEERVRRGYLPSDIPLADPLPTVEGCFRLGVYLGGGEASWYPWGGGEQHIWILGTTNAGKSVTAHGLVVQAIEAMGWLVKVADGKGGNDFQWVADAYSREQAVVCKRPGSIATLFKEMAREVQRRSERFEGLRVPREDDAGVLRALPPMNVREFSSEERERYGFQPILFVIDELAKLLVAEAGAPLPPKVKGVQPPRPTPILDALTTIAAVGRSVGVHIAAIQQRGDASILPGFVANLLAARVLVGATSRIAESMALDDAGAQFLYEAAEAMGHPPEVLERSLRPPGRAVVSGIENHPPALIHIRRFQTISRAPTWEQWSAEHPGAEPPAAPPAVDSPPTALRPAVPLDGSGTPATGEPYALGAAADASAPRAAPTAAGSTSSLSFGEGESPTPTAPHEATAHPAPTLTVAAPPSPPPLPIGKPRRPAAVVARRLRMRAAVWRRLLSPMTPDPPRNTALRAAVLRRDGGVCRVCGVLDLEWAADHPHALFLGGADVMANLQTLCLDCHRIKTREETRLRAWRRRRLRLSVENRLRRWWRRLPPWARVGLAVWLVGMAAPDRWWKLSGVVLLFLTVGIWWLAKRARKLTGHQRGPGIDGLSTFDKRMELQTTTGYDKVVTSLHYGGRKRAWQTRYVGIGLAAVFLLGHFTPALLLALLGNVL